MTMQEAINKYFSKKKAQLKNVAKDDEAHSSICKEIGISKGDLIGKWLEKLKDIDEKEGGVDSNDRPFGTDSVRAGSSPAAGFKLGTSSIRKEFSGSKARSSVKSTKKPSRPAKTLRNYLERDISGEKSSAETKDDGSASFVVEDRKEGLKMLSAVGNEERKERIRQFAEISPQDVGDLTINIHLYLPKTAQKLSRIFRVLQTIQRFNTARNLTTIFIKSIRCIENLVKQRVEVADIERMYFIAPGFFNFKEISILHDEKEANTFTIQIYGDAGEFDRKLFEHIKRCHCEFLERNGLSCMGSRFHHEFDLEKVLLPRKALFSERETEERSIQSVSETSPRPNKRQADVENAAKKKASTILERIREKERLRREEFINKSKEKEDNAVLNRRIQSLLMSEDKKAMAVKRVVELLKIFDGINAVHRLTKSEESLFHIKVMGDTEYLIFKTECNK